MSRPYNIPFKLNGRMYTRRYAWFPTRTSDDSWIWLVDYYTRQGRHGTVILDNFGYQQDSNQL